MEKFYYFFIENYADKTMLSFFDEMILLLFDFLLFLFILICCFLTYRFFKFIRNNLKGIKDPYPFALEIFHIKFRVLTFLSIFWGLIIVMILSLTPKIQFNKYIKYSDGMLLKDLKTLNLTQAEENDIYQFFVQLKKENEESDIYNFEDLKIELKKKYKY